MQIDFLGIQAFLAIVECGSFALAASQLNLSQTAVSHRMRKLEESLGVRLIVRTTREVTLTDAGRALLPKARGAVQQLRTSCETVRKHGQSAHQWLAFACLPTIAVGIMTPLLAAHHAAYPDAQVRVFDSSIPEIVELVESRSAAFGITILQPLAAEFLVEPIAPEPFVLVCRQDHELSRRASVRWTELESLPLIRISLAAGNSMTIDESLGALRERLRWRYETQRTAMALDMVREGLGITVVPRLSVPHRDGLACVKLEKPLVTRPLAVITRLDAALDEQQRFLRDRAVALISQRLNARATQAA